MQCPKCQGDVEQVMCGEVEVDRCLSCGGLWFDRGEAEVLSQEWIAEFLDTGDPTKGQVMDDMESLGCPRCGSAMRFSFEIDQSQVQFEECDDHGKFFDAGEFTLWAENQYL